MEASDTRNDTDLKIPPILSIGLLGMVILAFLNLLKPFFTTLFWAAIAGIFKPLYDRLLVKRRRPNLGASLMFCLIILNILLPASFMLRLLVTESMDIFNSISADTGAIDIESVCNSNVLVVNCAAEIETIWRTPTQTVEK